MKHGNLAPALVVALGEAIRIAAEQLRERMGASPDDVAVALTQAASMSFVRVHGLGGLENARTVIDSIEAELVDHAQASGGA